MELGELTQLKVYEGIVKRCSDEGKLQWVKLFAGFICDISEKNRQRNFDELKYWGDKRNPTDLDIKNLELCRKDVAMNERWIDSYTKGSRKYNELIDQAKNYSWKQD